MIYTSFKMTNNKNGCYQNHYLNMCDLLSHASMTQSMLKCKMSYNFFLLLFPYITEILLSNMAKFLHFLALFALILDCSDQGFDQTPVPGARHKNLIITVHSSNNKPKSVGQ